MYFINGEKDEDKMWVAIGVLLFFIMLLVLVFISVLNTGKKNPGTMEKLTRYDNERWRLGVLFAHYPFLKTG